MDFLGLLIRALLAGALAAGIGCTRLADTFVYAPARAVSGTPGTLGLAFDDVRFPAADGTELHGWWVPGPRPGPCVVFLHDRSGNVSDRLDILKRFHERLGLGVFLFDYRGYGRSAGRPSEAGLAADARGARSWVRRQGLDRAGEVLFGRGLGAAVALASAVEEPPSGLVLEGAFTSLEELFRLRHPLLWRLAAFSLAGRHDNRERVRALGAPVLFLHGDRDAVVPIAMGWRLFDAAPPPKRFRTVAGAGHDDLAFVGGEAYWEAWRTFVEELDPGGPLKGGSPPADR